MLIQSNKLTDIDKFQDSTRILPTLRVLECGSPLGLVNFAKT